MAGLALTTDRGYYIILVIPPTHGSSHIAIHMNSCVPGVVCAHNLSSYVLTGLSTHYNQNHRLPLCGAMINTDYLISKVSVKLVCSIRDSW